MLKFDPLSNSNKPIDLKKDRAVAEQQKKEKTATQFEEIFALQLVREMTKGTFKMSDNNQDKGVAAIYRSHVNQVLAQELASKHKLGIANLMLKYWDQKNESSSSS